jgi:predicted nuclease with TOPRIM domain
VFLRRRWFRHRLRDFRNVSCVDVGFFRFASQGALTDAQRESASVLTERDSRIYEMTTALSAAEERIAEGNAVLDELHSKFSAQLNGVLGRLEELMHEGPVARMQSAVETVSTELQALNSHCKQLEERLEVFNATPSQYDG